MSQQNKEPNETSTININRPRRLIKFYHEYEMPYGCFSNFYKHETVMNGEKFPTTEHYFQAKKFEHDKPFFQQIKNSRTPSIAKQLGSSRTHVLRPDWEDVKEPIMLEALRVKFADPHLKEILLSTGDSILIEHTQNDRYWADGGNGSGKNRLGFLLMQVREELMKS